MSALSDRLEALPGEHRTALEWFHTRRGQLIGKPEPVGGIHVFNPQTGIQKPAGWAYAVSVRQTLTSLYDDGAPKPSADGSWTYEYFQERKDPDKAAALATNRGLFACLDDDVPVAVMVQEKPKPGVLYRVWGLAKIVRFTEGHFHLQGYNDAGELPPSALAFSPDFPVVPTTYAAVTEPGLPIDLTDARERIAAQIFVRQGGGAFRNEALKRFNNRCAVSGWDVRQVLEAAHIVPYRGKHTNTADNALLLRADLHTLFDCELLTIDPATLRVRLSDKLIAGPYAAFDGKEIAMPTGVSPETLRSRLLERAEALKADHT